MENEYRILQVKCSLHRDRLVGLGSHKEQHRCFSTIFVHFHPFRQFLEFISLRRGRALSERAWGACFSRRMYSALYGIMFSACEWTMLELRKRTVTEFGIFSCQVFFTDQLDLIHPRKKHPWSESGGAGAAAG